MQISNWRGTWTAAWYPPGSFVSHSNLPWVATQQVNSSDPAPDAATSTKWLRLGSLPRSVVIASSNTTIPASADGNTYMHTGSSNITYTLPRASGSGAVDNGWEVVVTNQGAGDLTIDGFGSDTVDGSATLVISTNGRAVRLQKTANTAWVTIADTATGGSPFTPSKSNIYDAVKAILVHNTAVTADDADDELDIATGAATTIADNSIAPIKAQAGTAAQQKAWRDRLDASKIDIGNTLPLSTAANIGDVHIFARPVASGLSWRDISAPSTVITSAQAGDVAAYFSTGWTRVGNIVGTGQNLLLDNPASPIAASASNANNVLYRAGNFYRNEPVHVADPTATYRAFATSDLPNTYVWGGAVNVNPTASTTTENTVIYSIPAGRWERKITTGGIAVWIGYDQPNWRGVVDDESAADRTVQAVGDVILFGGTMRYVTAYTARTPDRWQWTRIRDKDLLARVIALADSKQDRLTTTQRIGLLQFDVIPGTVIGYTTTGQATDWLTDWRIWVSGGDSVGDVWMTMSLEGLPTNAAPAPTTPGADLKRHKLSATNIYNFTSSNENRNNLVSTRTSRRQGRDIEVDLRFYDAVSGGNLIDLITLSVDWVGSSGGLTQSQVDARVLALRSLVPTFATPASGDRIFFTDENQTGDPLRVTQMTTLATAMGVKTRFETAVGASAATGNVPAGTHTLEIELSDTEHARAAVQRILLSKLSATTKQIYVRFASGADVRLSLTYVSSSRTLTYTLTGGGASGDTVAITAIGES